MTKWFVELDCPNVTAMEDIAAGRLKPDGYCIEVTDLLPRKAAEGSVYHKRQRQKVMEHLCAKYEADCAVLIKDEGDGVIRVIDEFLDEEGILAGYKRRPRRDYVNDTFSGT